MPTDNSVDEGQSIRGCGRQGLIGARKELLEGEGDL